MTGQNVVIDANRAGIDDFAADNDSNDVGGGFYSNGAAAIVDLSRVQITNNAAHGRGGGFYNDADGSVFLTDFTISGNTTNQSSTESQGRGGGFWNSGNADVTLVRGEITDNKSFGHGGGFYQQDAGSNVIATNVTISGNLAGWDTISSSLVANRDGGGLAPNSTGATVALDHVTVANNQSTGNGGGIHRFGGDVTLRNSIVADNLADVDSVPIASDTNGDIELAEANIIVDVQGGTLSGNTAGLISTNPNLQPLNANGGFSRTHALLPTSIAVDASTGSTATEDQRAFSRTFVGNVASDLGAFEIAPLQYTAAGIGLRVRLDAATMTMIELVDDATGTVVERSPYASTLSIIITGGISDEKVIVDFVNGNPIPAGGLSFDGGGPGDNDSLEVADGVFTTVTHDLIDGSSGTIDLTGFGTITYTGLEPVIIPSGTIADHQHGRRQ